MNTFTKTSMAVGVSLALAPFAMADVIDFDVNGINSWDGLGDLDNDILSIDLAATLGLASGTSVTISEVSWDVLISTTAVPGTWMADATVNFQDSNGDNAGLFLSPGASTTGPGSQVFSSGGFLDLTDNGLADLVLTDGLLMLEFFESYVEGPDQIEAVWSNSLLSAGLISVEANATVVPIPAAFPLLVSGLLGLFAAGRRRRAA